jgi:crotonobetainyl-CoA:carnitine CoA-transferase CaiB-like acyl-CoA transferase
MNAFNGFLDGVRVLDLSRYLPGPFSAQILADMGADVLKIEPPQGDEIRRLGPRAADGRPVFFDAVNAGKRVQRLDLRQEEDRTVLLEHVAQADIFIESFRPGTLEGFGIGVDRLRGINPRLICLSLSGFGKAGPYRDRAAFDMNHLALSGVLAGTGARERPWPLLPPVADTTGALYAAIAVLGALTGRARTGVGCEIDLALIDTLMPPQALQLAEWGCTGHAPQREAEFLNGGAACYRAYRTRDGHHVTLAAVDPRFWANFCKGAGRPEWAARQGDPLPQVSLIAELDDFFGTVTRAESAALFEQLDCGFAPVLTLKEAVASPHSMNRDLLRRGPRGELQALFPALVNGSAPATRGAVIEE